MHFTFFNVESILVFNSTFVVVCSANSYPFGLPFRSKHLPIDILKFLVTSLSNMDNKFVFILVYEDGALARSYEFMRTCHNMYVIVQTIGGYASSIDAKSESLNMTLSDTEIALILNSNNMK